MEKYQRSFRMRVFAPYFVDMDGNQCPCQECFERRHPNV